MSEQHSQRSGEAASAPVAGASDTRARIVDSAARAARRRLSAGHGSPHPVVSEDRNEGRLLVAGLTATIDLAALVDELAGVPPHRWPHRVAGFVDTAIDAAVTVGGLRFTHWADVEPRLLIRLVPSVLAGPLATPVGAGLSFGLAVDLAVDPTGERAGLQPSIRSRTGAAVVVPSREQLAAWDRDPDRIWRCARANTRRWLKPTVTGMTVGPLEVAILTGGPFTAGVLFDVWYFLRQTEVDGPTDGRAWCWGAALSPSVVVLVDGGLEPVEAVDRLLRGLFEQTIDGFAPNRFPIDIPGARLTAVDGQTSRMH